MRVVGTEEAVPDVFALLVIGDGTCLCSQYWMGVLPSSTDVRLSFFITLQNWKMLEHRNTHVLPTPFIAVVVSGYIVDNVPLPTPDGTPPPKMIADIQRTLDGYM